MDTREINHRRCHLYRGAGIRHLVEAIAQRTPTDTVDDVLATMRMAQRPVNRFPDVDMVAHKAKQYVACSNCLKPVTVDDVQANECSHCGSAILSKGKVRHGNDKVLSG